MPACELCMDLHGRPSPACLRQGLALLGIVELCGVPAVEHKRCITCGTSFSRVLVLAEAVSKRTLQSRTFEIGLREWPTTASERVGIGKATPQNLEIYCFDTIHQGLVTVPSARGSDTENEVSVSSDRASIAP
jgi:hypothetical protein